MLLLFLEEPQASLWYPLFIRNFFYPLFSNNFQDVLLPQPGVPTMNKNCIIWGKNLKFNQFSNCWESYINIDTYIHTYIHTYRQTDRQTDRPKKHYVRLSIKNHKKEDQRVWYGIMKNEKHQNQQTSFSHDFLLTNLIITVYFIITGSITSGIPKIHSPSFFLFLRQTFT